MSKEKEEKLAEISARITKVIEYLGETANSFATKLGYQRAQTIYDIQKKKSAPSYDFFQRFTIAGYSAIINLDWLLTGEGNMLRNEVAATSFPAPEKKRHLIPLFDITTIGGRQYDADMTAVSAPSEMIDTGDLTMYCHWDKGLVCKKEFYCDTCEHQPAADDKENGKAEPVHIRWAEDYWSGRYPECPSCGNMPYSLERCVFCGQRFLPDALTEEWSKPPEEVRMDCPSCGGKSTMVGARARSNGHFHGQCTVCGCVVME